MKRLLPIFELSKNEQRVVLIVMLVLLVFAFTAYERRVHHAAVRQTLATELQATPSPVQTEDEQ